MSSCRVQGSANKLRLLNYLYPAAGVVAKRKHEQRNGEAGLFFETASRPSASTSDLKSSVQSNLKAEEPGAPAAYAFTILAFRVSLLLPRSCQHSLLLV